MDGACQPKQPSELTGASQPHPQPSFPFFPSPLLPSLLHTSLRCIYCFLDQISTTPRSALRAEAAFSFHSTSPAPIEPISSSTICGAHLGILRRTLVHQTSLLSTTAILRVGRDRCLPLSYRQASQTWPCSFQVSDPSALELHHPPAHYLDSALTPFGPITLHCPVALHLC
jgi:hypothetical protein